MIQDYVTGLGSTAAYFAKRKEDEIMSQKKVDAYKEQKANRRKIMKREKAVLRLEKFLALLVCVIAVVWIGFSVHDKATEGQTTEQIVTEMNTSALDNYLTELNTEIAE